MERTFFGTEDGKRIFLQVEGMNVFFDRIGSPFRAGERVDVRYNHLGCGRVHFYVRSLDGTKVQSKIHGNGVA